MDAGEILDLLLQHFRHARDLDAHLGLTEWGNKIADSLPGDANDDRYNILDDLTYMTIAASQISRRGEHELLTASLAERERRLAVLRDRQGRGCL